MPFFEWDEKKNKLNISKHKISFEESQVAFKDPRRLIFKDLSHSIKNEDRYYCLGKIKDKICTVRFTVRNGSIRIFGAGYWRQGKKNYEKSIE